jgi:hypothetical protein
MFLIDGYYISTSRSLFDLFQHSYCPMNISNAVRTRTGYLRPSNNFEICDMLFYEFKESVFVEERAMTLQYLFSTKIDIIKGN